MSCFARFARAGFIDDWFTRSSRKSVSQPSEPISDELFMRRVYLDLIGRLPSVEEARRFIGSTDEDKRERLVEQLLDRPEYADHWAGYWADLLRPNPYRVGIKAVLNYDNWIRQQFRDNVPYDAFAEAVGHGQGQHVAQRRRNVVSRSSQSG